jgi:hypothetical protein
VSRWTELSLGDVLAVIHGFAFRGEHFTEAGTHVLLTPKNFLAEGGLDLRPDRCKFYAGPIDGRFLLAWIYGGPDRPVLIVDSASLGVGRGGFGGVPLRGGLDLADDLA